MENNSFFALGRALGLFPFGKNGESTTGLIRYSVIFNVANFAFICWVRFCLHIEPIRNITILLSYGKFCILSSSILYHAVTVIRFKEDIHFILRTLERCNDWAPIASATNLIFTVFIIDTVEIVCVIALHFMSPPTSNAWNKTMTYLLFPYLSIFETIIILQSVVFVGAVLRVRKTLDSTPVSVSSVRKHFALHKVCLKIDEFYGIPILLALIQDFVVVVQVLSMYFFQILKLTLFKNSVYLNLWVLVMFAKLINFTMKLFIIVICFERVKKQMDAYVYRIFDELRSTNRFNNQYNMFEHYLHLKPFVRFTAARFFDINYPVIIPMLGAALTYLTIIVSL